MRIKLIFDEKLLTWFVLYGEARGIHKRFAWCSILGREELESVSVFIFNNATELFSLLKIRSFHFKNVPTFQDCCFLSSVLVFVFAPIFFPSS